MFIVNLTCVSGDRIVNQCLVSFKFFILFYFINKFCLHVYLCTVCMLVSGMSEDNSVSSETGFTDGHEPTCCCCKLNLGPLQEQKNAFNHRAISSASSGQCV